VAQKLGADLDRSLAGASGLKATSTAESDQDSGASAASIRPMPESSGREQGEVTALLRQWQEGDPRALERLTELVYDKLRRMARAYLAGERPDHTLQPTALVHETYLRLVDHKAMAWEDRRHFFAIAATTMRRILVDHARGQRREKRGGDRPRLSLDAVGELPAADRAAEVVAVDDALERLATEDRLKVSVVELRFFAGLTNGEAAAVLGLSEPTVRRHWRAAKLWLYHELRSPS
jgi:RNA polymerase sigma factor (TIGR02999 family)